MKLAVSVNPTARLWAALTLATALMTAMLAGACVGPSQTSSPRQDRMVKTFEVPPDKALLFIYKTTPLPIGDVDRIHLNGRYIADVDTNLYIAILVDPGNYQLTRRAGSVTRYAGEFSFDVRGGEKLYLARDFGTSKVHYFRIDDNHQGEAQINRRRLARYDDRSFVSTARLAPQVAKMDAPVVHFPTEPVSLSYLPGGSRPDDVAVIIGNANYQRLGKDIPNVTPAYADAEGFRRYARQALGIANDNIIFIKDATLKDMLATFGSESNYKGRLFRYLTRGLSRVFVFYAGHGAPGEDGNNLLVPSDAEASLIELNGYRLKTLYRNLSKLPASSVTVVLEACFSGAIQAGSVINNASPIFMKARNTSIPSNLTVVSAGAANQIASWEKDKSHSLFSRQFLTAMSGAADYDENRSVSWDEVRKFLSITVTRSAMRTYGREQRPQVVVGQ